MINFWNNLERFENEERNIRIIKKVNEVDFQLVEVMIASFDDLIK
jgi:hypothetical protein